MSDRKTQIANRRAFQDINGLNATPMLEFVCWADFVLTNRTWKLR